MRDLSGKEVVIEGRIFLGGVPTKVDVDKLVEHFGVPGIDVLIRWSDIEKCLGISKHKARFGTVVDAWRRFLMEKHNVYLGAVHGYGLRACNPPDRVVASSTQQKHAFRKIVRASVLAATTDPTELTPEQRSVRDHVVNVGAVHKLAVKTAAKTLDFKSAIGK